MKHLETKWMWGQDYIHRHQVTVKKVHREINCADALASPCTPSDLSKHLDAMGFNRQGTGCQVRDGPSSSCT